MAFHPCSEQLNFIRLFAETETSFLDQPVCKMPTAGQCEDFLRRPYVDPGTKCLYPMKTLHREVR